jgi:tRNA threonylcarbamoyl adenosine modification protein YeaZ
VAAVDIGDGTKDTARRFVRFVITFIIVDSMLVLALDTHHPNREQCALPGSPRPDGDTERPGKSHAEHLPGDLMALLDAAHVRARRGGRIRRRHRPGSFTGLRVGIATMQGLAFATNKPLVGISGLDALAHRAWRERPDVSVATWIDAWRGEVYAALYDSRREVESPSVEHPSSVLERLRGQRPGPVRRRWCRDVRRDDCSDGSASVPSSPPRRRHAGRSRCPIGGRCARRR